MPASVRKSNSAPDASVEARVKNRRKLWWLVAGTTLVIIALWFVLVGLHLSRTSSGDESLYERIKREVRSVFSGRSTNSTTNGAISNQDLKDLEDRVFPNSNVQPSGSFTIE